MSKFADHAPKHPLVAELLPTSKPATGTVAPPEAEDDGSPDCDCPNAPTAHLSTCFHAKEDREWRNEIAREEGMLNGIDSFNDWNESLA